MATIADLVTEARALVNDERAPYRDTDQKFVAAVNRAMNELKRLRPDAFYELFDDDLDVAVPEYTTSNMGTSSFPADMIFWTSVLYFVAGSIELKDDEFTADGRAVTLMQRFAAQVQSQQ